MLRLKEISPKEGPSALSENWLRGLEATYTERGSITIDNRENRSKTRTCKPPRIYPTSDPDLRRSGLERRSLSFFWHLGILS